jgi:Acetyltransferase (GNAT) domain
LVETGTESGYLHPSYADALSEFGHPRPLIQSRGWILQRDIAGTNVHDAMGCYPLFSCRDWSLLKDDLEGLGRELVSLVLVADPFGNFSKELLRATFPDLVVPFKEHFVADLRQPTSAFVSKHHQYYARKALETVSVEPNDNPAGMLDEWSGLYELLVERHQLTGIKAFSRTSFAKQLSAPGLTILRATHKGQTVGAHLWYVQGDVAFSHLTASNELGYKLMASYALSWRALEYFAGKTRWIDWGAGAGLDSFGGDGLTQFKRGWANTTRPAYLCGRIFDQPKYEELSRAKGLAGSQYFPLYRNGELDVVGAMKTTASQRAKR